MLIPAALTTPNTLWNFSPNLGASAFLSVLLGFTTIAHLVQAILYRKAYCWIIIVSGAMQTLSYIFRSLSIQNPASLPAYAGMIFSCILSPPTVLNIYVPFYFYICFLVKLLLTSEFSIAWFVLILVSADSP